MNWLIALCCLASFLSHLVIFPKVKFFAWIWPLWSLTLATSKEKANDLLLDTVYLFIFCKNKEEGSICFCTVNLYMVSLLGNISYDSFTYLFNNWLRSFGRYKIGQAFIGKLSVGFSLDMWLEEAKDFLKGMRSM